MKKIIMLREKIYQAKEFEVDPQDPDHKLCDYERFGNESDEGFWNEYYRVGVVNAEDEEVDQDDEFQNTAQDFYSYGDALEYYDNLERELKKKGELCA